MQHAVRDRLSFLKQVKVQSCHVYMCSELACRSYLQPSSSIAATHSSFATTNGIVRELLLSYGLGATAILLDEYTISYDLDKEE